MVWNLNFDNLPKLLNVYSDEDYVQQQRVKFIYYLCLTLLAIVTTLIIYRLLSHPLNISYDPSHLRVLLPLTFLLLSVLVSLLLLIKGYYDTAANILPSVMVVVIWVIIFLERQSLLIRFDTIVYIFAALTIVPLLVRRNTFVIFLYPVINITILVLFILLFKDKIGITKPEIRDYIIDVSISLAFVGFLGYNIYSINTKALQNAAAFNKKKDEAESALSRSEKRYREMALLLPQTIYEANSEGFLTYMNKAGIDMFGYSEEDLRRGVNVINVIVNEDRDRLYINFLGVVGGTSTHGNKYMALRKDGLRFPVEIFSVPIIENDKHVGARGVIYDISERVKAETELMKSHELFRVLVEANPFSINLSDTDGRIVIINNAFLEYSGFTREEVIGKTFEELEIKIDNEEDARKELREKGFINNFETTIYYKNGNKRDIILHSAVINVNNEKAVLSSTIDITERKILENKLKENEELFRTMTEMVPYSIHILDKDFKHVAANEAFLKRFHFTMDDIRGKSFKDLGFIEEEEAAYNIAMELRSKGMISNLETGHTSPEGKKIYSLISIKPLILEKEPHYIVTAVDISDRKALEDKLLDYNQHLEDLVKERTEELAAANSDLKETNEELKSQREQLEVTYKKLEEAQSQLIETEKMASLGILTAGVAHEINNPLNYIFNGTIAIESLIKEKYPDQMEELKPLFDAIGLGIDRASGIIKSLNIYSRQEEKTSNRCNVQEIIDNCLAMLYNQYSGRIEIVKHYMDDIPLIQGREGKLHQAFLNILTNAIQSIEKEGRIIITTGFANNILSEKISDTGVGISAANMKYIFDPFFTTKDPGKGTGLGLSVTQKIIQEHGGTIICKSKIAEGSEFIINLLLNQ